MRPRLKLPASQGVGIYIPDGKPTAADSPKLLSGAIMAGQSRKWMILVATIWIQAFTGTNFDFSAYSSKLKSVLAISQVQLNYLAVASDLGKAFGWSSGLALLYLPLPVVLFMAAFIGFVAYGLQWLVIKEFISLPYFPVFLLCLMAGCSICWFNTVAFVLCIRNFPVNRSLALALTVSFNGVSPALYTFAANAISSNDDALYLLLNCLLPLLTAVAALVPILRQPPVYPLPPDAARRDSLVFLVLNVVAVLTGLYLLLLNSVSADTSTYRYLFGGALLLLVLPLCIPGIVYARSWANRIIHASFRVEGAGFNLVDLDNLDLQKELMGTETGDGNGNGELDWMERNRSCCDAILKGNQLKVLGEEHSVMMLVRRIDFWLYYLAYFWGATVGLVYSNNLGQIAQSLGAEAQTTDLVTLYSACSFFGRLLSAAPDFLPGKLYFARTGWLAMALTPMPIAFLLLVATSSLVALKAATGLIGLSSGFIFAAAVSVTSELFGPNSFGVNHNIVITNIPLGSLLYGSLAAFVYDLNASSNLKKKMILNDMVVCMGTKCYKDTFAWWGCITLAGLVCSVMLFLRTKSAFDHFEQHRIMSQTF